MVSLGRFRTVSYYFGKSRVVSSFRTTKTRGSDDCRSKKSATKMFSRLALRNAQMLPIAVRGVQTVTTSNSPRPTRLVDPTPVRFGFLPDSWFTFFYPKTGVTGPYIFGTSVATYLLSKEIYVLEHEFHNAVSFVIIWIFLVKKFGPTVSKYLEKEQNKEIEEFEDQRKEGIKNAEDNINQTKNAIWSAEGQSLLMEAKRENIKIQLESIYRERLAHVYQEVKKRLDYNAQIQIVERRIAQKHMVQWIINNVLKAITPEQEKATLQQCIKDLEALSAKA
ncbi:PREDICTED: ATP synthase subunit b, mitochondrial isoform X2 [Polistes canadensis]|uniref:ATP synthase subunit b, mitochondrial isoform X2 n=1 Tax=Polistes canadensis TaxID=91411 RepID=UPI000718C952|nr:PREDICTED: ATP synthase subunit b, mitochondrial isoform X2 [Polistes canadensis]